MIEHEMTRTLVKSQPEVWAQCSEADSLGRHLNGSFGEIRITRLEPEHSVAWEGEEVSGTVRIEPSAWGTRVTLSVQREHEHQPEAAAVEEVVPEPAPAPEPEADAEDELSDESVTYPTTFLARLRAKFRRPAEAEPPAPEHEEPEAEVPSAPEAEPEPEPEPPQLEPQGADKTTEALNAALESMGQAHHRPFSRA